jgi:hypothetical protein
LKKGLLDDQVQTQNTSIFKSNGIRVQTKQPSGVPGYYINQDCLENYLTDNTVPYFPESTADYYSD